jgi:hypothetical protein
MMAHFQGRHKLWKYYLRRISRNRAISLVFLLRALDHGELPRARDQCVVGQYGTGILLDHVVFQIVYDMPLVAKSAEQRKNLLPVLFFNFLVGAGEDYIIIIVFSRKSFTHFLFALIHSLTTLIPVLIYFVGLGKESVPISVNYPGFGIHSSFLAYNCLKVH